MDADGRNVKRLTHEPDISYLTPVWGARREPDRFQSLESKD